MVNLETNGILTTCICGARSTEIGTSRRIKGSGGGGEMSLPLPLSCAITGLVSALHRKMKGSKDLYAAPKRVRDKIHASFESRNWKVCVPRPKCPPPRMTPLRTLSTTGI